MSEKQMDLNDNRTRQLETFARLLPDVLGHVRDQAVETYRDGVLDGKTKRLMALAVALGAGCRNCVLGQTAFALEKGATQEEILETIAVVVSMRGTTGIAESLRVIQFLEEQGMLE